MFDPKDYAGKFGFSVTLDNGFVVSVQFGGTAYCSNHLVQSGSEEPSRTAETAVIDPSGLFVKMNPTDTGDDDVQGWQTPNQVLATIARASKMKAGDWELLSLKTV